MTNIKGYIQHLAGSAPVQTYLCKVISVDGDKCDCAPVQGGADFLDVRLRSVLDDSTDGLLITPKKDSLVLIGIIENDSAKAFVIQYSDIDKLNFKNANGMTVDVLPSVIKLNGDQEEGLVKVKDLKTKLNNVEGELNDLKTILTTWVPVANDGGAALKALVTTWASQPIVPTQQADIENPKVKHG